ncbi:rod outer segment membrane protein 1-like [Plodia interpunctella]|uniref:rod outer segment membrane protein 1-like n=1 Tax=Plodia interpunctella TaxID=58824 RepID=UPI002367AB90|nr:rod outer segment membrane protein 1-like [Plodia interpunctella]XP_053613132.1 rod outer segment membrane protein 1-like [Plodia interpunctella]
MARAAFSFSREGRQRLAGVLRALLIAQLVLSLVTAIYCYNASQRVMSLLKHIHKITVYLLYGLILCHAYCMKLHYTSGLRLITLLLQSPYWPRGTLVTKIWLLTGTMVAANGMLVYAAYRGTLRALSKELASSLSVGISQYLAEPTWKSLMDTMQVELSCCGVDKPSDWHKIPWLNMDFLNENSSLVLTVASSDGKVLPPVTPYSCCTPRVLSACYHDPLQQSEWAGVWAVSSALVPASLHTRGCVEAVRAPLTRALLALHCFAMLVCLLQIIIVALTQLLRTSARSAVLAGVCDGVGVGSLLPATPLIPTENLACSVEAPQCHASSSCAIALTRRRRRRIPAVSTSYPCLS